VGELFITVEDERHRSECSPVMPDRPYGEEGRASGFEEGEMMRSELLSYAARK
jgi:hypothetical protein